MRIYVSGGITDVPDYRDAFDLAARDLRNMGHVAINPATSGHGEMPWSQYLRRDLKWLIECDAVCVLEGWETSRGARLEVHVARELDMPIMRLSGMGDRLEPVETDPASILVEADRLINGARQSDYGHPIDNFTQTGRVWAALLNIDDIPAETVGLMMVGAKLSRETNVHKRDNLVDAAGYAGTVEKVIDERARRATL